MGEQLSKEVSIRNKKASFLYEFLEKFEAGIQLKGTEIKSIRMGKASIKEGYCAFKNGELFVYNINITPYENASFTIKEIVQRVNLLYCKAVNVFHRFWQCLASKQNSSVCCLDLTTHLD